MSNILNNEQLIVAQNTVDNLLVLAGAGTGKTDTLAARVAFLLQNNITPDSIICLTFTNRACREITERACAEDVLVCTFHRFCVHLLRNAPDAFCDFGRDFIVCDEDDALETIKAVVHEGIGRYIEDRDALILQRFIGMIKDCQLDAPKLDCRQATAFILTQNRKAVEKICIASDYTFDAKFYRFLAKYGASITELYNYKLRESNTLDFADLLIYANRLVLIPKMNFLRTHYKYIHVDEAQDMNLSEYHFLKNFCDDAKILLCGDFNQTIYEWRGSNPISLIEEFKKLSPLTITFTQNYRCSGQLLSAATNFLYNAFNQGDGTIFDPTTLGCTDIIMEEFADPTTEVNWIYRQIEALELTDLSRCAILTRNNKACKTVCDILKLHRLNNSQMLRFMSSDELRLFRRPEVKKALAYLRFLIDPFDNESLRRILSGFSIRKENPFIRPTDFIDNRTAQTGDFFSPLLTALDNNDIIVFDVESTGTNVYTDDIIQIAAIRLASTGEIIQRFERFLLPSKSVGDSEAIHGFSDNFLSEHGSSPIKVLEEFLDFVGNSVIVGHNVHFDMTITAQNLIHHNISRDFTNIWYDTLDLARRFLPKLPNHKLSTVSDFLQTHTPSHDAMDDILATAGILIKLTNDFLIPNTEIRRTCYKKYLAKFLPIAEQFKNLRNNPPQTVPILLDQIDDIFLLSKDSKPTEKANLLLLRDFAEDFGKPDLPLPQQISLLLELTALTSGELDRMGKSQNKIPVITVHQAKGCEFDYVFMPTLIENVFPTYQAISSGNDNEERRVFYVSITRAKKRLYLSWTRRNQLGRLCTPSRYLQMLNPNLSQS